MRSSYWSVRRGIGHSSGGREATGMLKDTNSQRRDKTPARQSSRAACEQEGAALPADAGNQRFGPDLGDDKERLCRLGFYVLVRGHQVVPFRVVLWVQSVKMV